MEKLTKSEREELEGLIQMTDKFDNVDPKSLLRRTELENKAGEEELIDICEKVGLDYNEIYNP